MQADDDAEQTLAAERDEHACADFGDEVAEGIGKGAVERDRQGDVGEEGHCSRVFAMAVDNQDPMLCEIRLSTRMRIRRFRCVAVFVHLGLCAASLQAQAVLHRGESQAWTEKTANGMSFVTKDTLFEFSDILNKAGTEYRHLLLQITSEQRRTDGLEGLQGKIAVQSWDTSGPQASRPLWSFSTVGNEVHPISGYEFIQVTTLPCCGSPTNHEYYSLSTGQLLYQTSEVGFSEMDKSLFRVFGQYDGKGYAGNRFVAMAEDAKAENTVVIRYGSESAVLQRIAITGGPVLNTAGDLPKISVHSAARSAQAQELYLNGGFTFTIHLTYEGGVTVDIPVKQDRIEPTGIILPKRFSAKSLDAMR